MSTVGVQIAASVKQFVDNAGDCTNHYKADDAAERLKEWSRSGYINVVFAELQKAIGEVSGDTAQGSYSPG